MTTIEEIKQAVRDVDPSIHSNDNTFKAMVVLLSLTQVRFDLREICAFTGYSPKRGIIQKFMCNIESNGIYKDGKIYCDWMGEDGAMALLLDAMVANGKLNRTNEEAV